MKRSVRLTTTVTAYYDGYGEATRINYPDARSVFTYRDYQENEFGAHVIAVTEDTTNAVFIMYCGAWGREIAKQT